MNMVRENDTRSLCPKRLENSNNDYSRKKFNSILNVSSTFEYSLFISKQKRIEKMMVWSEISPNVVNVVINLKEILFDKNIYSDSLLNTTLHTRTI